MGPEKAALVTGASGGIGSEIVRALASDGYSVFLHYHTNESAAFRLEKELKHAYPNQTFTTIGADLSLESGVRTLLSGIHCPIECVIHNCGRGHVGLMIDVGHDTLAAMMQLNIASPFLLTQKLLPDMIRAKQGKIIFITSIWGVTGASMEVLYSTMKGAQNSLVKALAKEVAPSGITVNAVAPGAVDTAMLAVHDKETIDLLKEEIPAGRLGTPTEIAALVRFLAAPESNYINGQVVSINGAWHC